MLYKIGCNPKHPFCGALPVPYLPVRVTRGALIAHHYTFAPPRCRTSQYRRTFIRRSVSLWDDLVDPVFDGVGLAGFKSRSMPFCWPSCTLIFCPHLLSLSLLFLYRLVVWGWGFRTDRCQSPSPGFALPIFFNNNNNKECFVLCFFILFHNCCSHALVFGNLLVHEFHISYSHTEWYSIFSYSAFFVFRAKR